MIKPSQPAVDVNFYGFDNPNREVSPKADKFDIQSRASSKRINIRSKGSKRRRYADMSPSQRENQRNDLLNKFKSNVMSLAQMEALDTSQNDLFANTGKSKFNKTSTGFSTQDITMSEFLNKNFTQTDAFSQRM